MPLTEDVRERQEKLKALDAAVGQIEKQFGKGSIMRLGQNNIIAPVESISTGAISIDHALGIGGVPRGRVVEIFGPESSGKRRWHCSIAEARWAAWRRLWTRTRADAAYAKKLGVDLTTCWVAANRAGLEIVEVIIRSNSVDVVGRLGRRARAPRRKSKARWAKRKWLQARLIAGTPQADRAVSKRRPR
jgi:recombination protein RecA